MYRRILICLIVSTSLGLYVTTLTGKQSPNLHKIPTFIQKHWDSENGLTQNTIKAICQSRDGYIWIGTQEGLLRFDGRRFIVLGEKEGYDIKSQYICALLVDKQDNLWIGTQSNGLYRYRNGRLMNFRRADGLLSESVYHLTEDDTGKLWIGTAEGLNYIKENKISIALNSDHNINVRSIALNRFHKDFLWIGTYGNGLKFYRNGNFLNYSKAKGLPSDTIHQLLRYKNQLWIGTEEGLCRYYNHRLETISRKGRPYSKRVKTLLVDSRGILWVGTENGLTRVHFGDTPYIDNIQLLKGKSIESIFEDSEKNLWIGTEFQGIFYLKKGRFDRISVKEGLSGNFIRPIYEDKKGNIWIGTVGTGLNKISTSIITDVKCETGIDCKIVNSMLEDHRGRIWIGTDRRGLICSDADKTVLYTEKNGLPHNRILSLYEDSSHNVWIGTYSKGLARFKEGEFTHYKISDGLSNERINFITGDGDGGIWICTNNGLNHLKDGVIKVLTTRDGMAGNVLNTAYLDPKGVLWIGTNGAGLSRYENGKFFHFDTKNGLSNDVVFSILEDKNGNFWISCNKGIYKVNKNELNRFAAGKTDSYYSAFYSGTENLECNGGFQPSACRSKSGRLWFPTVKGVIVINPEEKTDRSFVPKTVLEEVVVDDRQYIYPNRMERRQFRFSPGKKRIGFQYTGFHFKNPDKLEFKYKLVGYDDNWIHAKNQRIAHYTQIPAGTYTFIVKARSYKGNWTPLGSTFNFSILPHFYNTGFFYVGMIVMGVLMVFMGYRYRISRFKRHQRKLEETVIDRTKELKSVNEELQKLSRLKNELMCVVVHDLKNPLSAIKRVSQGLSVPCENKKEVCSEGPEIITRSVNHMLEIINDLLKTTRVENGELQLKLKPVDLGKLVYEIIDNYRDKITLKSLTLDTDIDNNCIINGDQLLIKAIIDNLIGNAVKFSPKGETVFVSVKKIFMNLYVTIKDRGPGFTDEDREKVFKKIQKLSAIPVEEEDSSGMGLYLCNRFIKVLNGRISLTSSKGEGSTFTLEFPVFAKNGNGSILTK